MSSEPASGTADDLRAYQEALSRGHQALLAGDPRRALSEYEAASRLAAERALPHLSAGRALMALGKPAEALAAFERAHERSPTDTGPLQGKVEALTRLGRQPEAAAVAEQIQELASRRQADRPAIDQPSPAAALGPEDGAAVLPRAEVLLDAAERAFRDGRHETAVSQWLEAAAAHAAEGHLHAALEACQRALLADHAAPRVHLEMSRHYLAMGWTDLAAERLELLARLAEMDDSSGLRPELLRVASGAAGSDPRIAALAERLGTETSG